MLVKSTPVGIGVVGTVEGGMLKRNSNPVVKENIPKELYFTV